MFQLAEPKLLLAHTVCCVNEYVVIGIPEMNPVELLNSKPAGRVDYLKGCNCPAGQTRNRMSALKSLRCDMYESMTYHVAESVECLKLQWLSPPYLNRFDWQLKCSKWLKIGQIMAFPKSNHLMVQK